MLYLISVLLCSIGPNLKTEPGYYRASSSSGSAENLEISLGHHLAAIPMWLLVIVLNVTLLYCSAVVLSNKVDVKLTQND